MSIAIRPVFQTVAASVPDTEKLPLAPNVSLGQTDLRSKTRLAAAIFGLAILILNYDILPASAQDELAKQPSWQVPTGEQIEQAIVGWLDEIKADTQSRTKVIEYVRSVHSSEPRLNRLETVLAAIEIIRPEIRVFSQQLGIQRVGIEPPDFSAILDNPHESPFVRDHVRLLYGRWLAQNELLDEAFDQLVQIDVTEILDPATLLFYRGLAEHQLLKREECLETISTLLENEDRLPRRFAILGRLMAADIAPLKADSLDEISRMMKDIRRRQSLYRSGRRVRNQEAEVIKKLDKAIAEIEKQQQQMQQQQQSSSQSSNPMEDSRNAGGQGSGEVTGKKQLDGGDWGSLPPAQRAAAMAEMSKDLPPHYRAVIEEYFRRLARDN